MQAEAKTLQTKGRSRSPVPAEVISLLNYALADVRQLSEPSARLLEQAIAKLADDARAQAANNVAAVAPPEGNACASPASVRSA